MKLGMKLGTKKPRLAAGDFLKGGYAMVSPYLSSSCR
mgnify:CR=1 FL=1